MLCFIHVTQKLKKSCDSKVALTSEHTCVTLLQEYCNLLHPIAVMVHLKLRFSFTTNLVRSLAPVTGPSGVRKL